MDTLGTQLASFMIAAVHLGWGEAVERLFSFVCMLLYSPLLRGLSSFGISFIRGSTIMWLSL